MQDGDPAATATEAKAGYQLEVEDRFDGAALDPTLWLPCYLPQWSSRDASAARYRLSDGTLHLRVEQDQPPWCPDLDGELRVSSLQTGMFAGPVGSPTGQHRFSPAAVVREEQENVRLYTPTYGFFEMRAKASADPHAMVALWMIGYEDLPENSAEICIFEIFGRDVRSSSAEVGMGVHPFGDPGIVDEFAAEQVRFDAREFHVYAAEWTPRHVAFFVDDGLVKVVHQAPAYQMQLMVSVYALPAPDGGAPPGPYPKQLVVDWFRGYRPRDRIR